MLDAGKELWILCAHPIVSLARFDSDGFPLWRCAICNSYIRHSVIRGNIKNLVCDRDDILAKVDATMVKEGK